VKVFKRVLAVIGLGVLAFAGFAVWKIGPHDLLGMLRYDTRQEGSVKIGDPAPDAILRLPDGSATTRLSDHFGRGKPLVLVFGSFT
jgi:hypothetical protein